MLRPSLTCLFLFHPRMTVCWEILRWRKSIDRNLSAHPPVAIYIHRATNPNVLLTFVLLITRIQMTSHISELQGGNAARISAGGSLVEESILSRERYFWIRGL